MNFRTDIKEALLDEREQRSTDIVTEVNALLRAEEETYRHIDSRLWTIGDVDPGIASRAGGEAFSIEEIRTIAIRYDLRFLDSCLFKGDIPAVALQTIRAREDQMGEGFRAFRILAPGELFQLEDENADPLLFGERSDGRHELIAQWGGDVSLMRAIRTYPKRNVLTLAATVVLITFLLVGLLPSEVFHMDTPLGLVPMAKPLLFFFLLTFFSGLTAYVWFAFGKQFSSQSWNSRSF